MPLKKLLRPTLLCFFFSLALSVSAQTNATQTASNEASPTVAPAADSGSNSTQTKSESEEVLRLLRAQQAELERMRELLKEQTKTINELQRRVEQTEVRMTTEVVRTTNVAASDTLAEAMRVPTTAPAPEGQKKEDADAAKADAERRKRNETLSKQFGSMTISGDLRFRYESFYGLLNATANDANPAILGNPLTTRQRFRLRARLNIRGNFGKDFDWGLRLATGSFADGIATNQTLTDFYNRKPFGLDQAYIAWSPERVPGLRLQAGKFDVPWVRTEMTIDNDLQPEGFNQIYSRGFKDSVFKNLTFVAWQLPFLERNSAFVRNPNGTISLNDSERGGRDLALYGAQVRGRFEFSKQVALTLSVADLYFSGTQFISPVQVFGNLLLLPITFTIPATATTPAQTITTQVAIPRDLLVAGNGNLGLSTATNNAVNRDGRLASGYNLVDVIARLDLKHSKQWPITLVMNFVTNTQTHDVVVAGPGGANQFLKNNENNGYYAELLAGKQEKRGDLQFGYTFVRLEKDAVLTPFNFSDLFQQSDVRAHRLIFNFTADPRVLLTLTGIVTERSNGLLGVFGSTPPGSLNRPTTRLQFDTSFRF
ncbi:MAG: putative porin [Pyrinomonadaceae bacterium]|nr:putative porin [Pyrinomonadaceae bacterium]